MLFDQDELEAWLKQGRIDGAAEVAVEASEVIKLPQVAEGRAGIVDISLQRVYHRSARYR